MITGRPDWKRIKERVRIQQLLEEDGATAGQLKGSDGVECPRHPGSKHAKVYDDGGFLMCWADEQPVSVIDWYAWRHGMEPLDAAIELSERFAVPMLDDERGAPREPLNQLQSLWARLCSYPLTDVGRAWLEGRGFHRHYLQGLVRRHLVASNPKRSTRIGDDEGEGGTHYEYRETVSFPAWAALDDCPTLQTDRPDCLWHRFVDPPLNGDGKPDKDRNQGSSRGVIFTAMPMHQLRSAKIVFICESVLKGLAVDVAIGGHDLTARIEDLQALIAGSATGADRSEAEADIKRLRAERDDVRRRWSGRAWFSLLGVGGAKKGKRDDLAKAHTILNHLYAHRQKRPSIRIALDNDATSTAAAFALCRELTCNGWEALVVKPPEKTKDWDGLLAASDDGGAEVRRCLADEHPDPLFRPGGHSIAPADWSHRHGWQLHAQTREEGKTVNDVIADFVVRGVMRYQLHAWDGRPDRSVFAVFACSRSETNGTYGMVEGWIAGEEFSKIDSWSRFGCVHNPSLFRRYISDAKDMVDRTRSVIPVVGLVRDPTQADRYQLVGGDVRTRLNQTYRQSFGTPYDHADWSGPWAGPRDAAIARADGRRLVETLRTMFRSPFGSIACYWIAGTLLKVVARYWPHMVAIGQKGSGKSTLLRALQRAFGMHTATLNDLNTDYRSLSAVSNHVFPVAFDEISRVPERRLSAVQALFNQLFDCGQNTLRYGSDQFPATLAASLYLTGQDTISDNESKQLSINLSKEEARAGVEPNLSALPRWPWGAWGRWLLDELREEPAAADLARWESLISRELPAGTNDRDRFGGCWARLMWARELVHRFLDLPTVAGDPWSHPEAAGIRNVMLAAARASSNTGEALDMLDKYCSIVQSEPGKHPVTWLVVGDPQQDGAWIVPSAIQETLRARGLQFAIRDARRFMDALRAEGLLGTPDIGHWKDGQPARRRIQHHMHGKPVRINSYLVPADVSNRLGLDWPDHDDGGTGPTSPPPDLPELPRGEADIKEMERRNRRRMFGDD